LTVLRYQNVDQAIEMANGTKYGLGAAVWTPSIDDALNTARRLRAGQVWVNNYDAADFTVPWGGLKRSGSGRDKSLEALQEYSASSAIWIQTTKERR
jgi:gamma-glutamyl-gamma-aminobutyraldehyde dehydrogenase/4-guanidinobutyraldehyde dehydrogenase/NAD-dependent aldehyde dehydrogenase